MCVASPAGSLSRDEDTPQQLDDDDDDSISITSTLPEDNDSEKEWEVDDILAERPHPDIPGALQYLISWEGFELEDATWEPVENLGDGLLAKWEENKAEIKAGTRKAFDLATYDAARAARETRRRRRTAKRLRLEPVSVAPPLPEYTEDTLMESPVDQDFPSSDEEAHEVDDIDPARIPPSKSKTTTRVLTSASTTTVPPAEPTSRKPDKQNTFRGVPSQISMKSSGTSALPEKGRDQQPPPQPPKTSTKASASGPSLLTTSGPVRRASGGTMTGYQGTARRSSLFRSTTTKVLAQTTPIPTNKPLPTARIPSVPSSSSAAGDTLKTKRLTATRTRQLPASTVENVFSGGKQRKKRANLGDVMGDPSKAPKAFSNMRLMNLAKKRGIEKGDAAGSLSSIPSKFIIGNERANTGPRRPSLVSPTIAAPSPNNDASGQLPTSPTTTTKPPVSSEATHEVIGEPAMLKRKKSVRFTGEDIQELSNIFDNPLDDDIEINPGLEDPDVGKGPSAVSKKLSLPAYQERGQTQAIQKLVKFGAAEAILISFDGIARYTAAWLTAFKAEKILHLSSTCSSFHFSTQKQQLIGEKLAAGTVEPVSSNHTLALKNVANSLQRGSMGLHLVTPEFSILVYPSGFDTCGSHWDWLDADTRKPTSDVALQHFIFRSPISHQSYPSNFYQQPKEFNKIVYPNGASDPEIVGVLTELDFNKLVPQDLRLKDKQAYMLLFPLREKQILGVIMAWLRHHQPGQPIYTIDQPNSWRLFHEFVQGGGGGTVISHAEYTLWKLEKIPNVWRMLEGQKYTFWHLDTGETKRPQYPSQLDATSVPGMLRLTRLFPYGRAFLITPSFVISEPAKLCAFLKWFKRYGANPGHIIVTCHEFPRFLRNIAEEKQEEHDKLKRLNPDNKDVHTYFERAGRTKQDIDDHVRAWHLLQEIIERFGDEGTSEDIRKIHWLSEFIDPSDEQSLANAFCWWTQLKCDRFRRFYILGSDPSRIQRAYRYIEIPRYFDTETSNPDIAGILIQRQLFATEPQKEADGHKTGPNIAWGTGGTVDKLSRVVGEWRNSICETPFSFPGTLFRTDAVQELQRWIDDHRRRTIKNWSELYQKPVSWRDRNMALQFGDADEHRSQLDTFEDWFWSAPKFTKKRNTWYGLFYTITDNWDEYMPKRKYERHPWVAIYRPKNPHHITPSGAFNTIELFIWDIAAADRGKFGHNLLDMQCQLIDYVYNAVGERYPGCSLSDVWYSSTTSLRIGQYDNPLDITCQKIEEMFNNGREELPPMDSLLVGKWASIDSRLWSAGMSTMTIRAKLAEKASELAFMRMPQNERDKLKPERMIWHPVHRGTKGRGAKCLNDLYEACLEARLKDPECNEIEYRYRPTQEWWADQVEEGRDYGYICVDLAGKIIDKLASAE
ncbi:putative chromo domain-containing protein [Rosellinia necatrix]|uniref:Putative chromo domain-containing protein n=1 Tax=Rosellinia necatrix TaxID=77044 RepID=A0A1W2TW27_ROSNE|nr:putative chromo domain-containing protein [Rosellinia necatrix]